MLPRVRSAFYDALTTHADDTRAVESREAREARERGSRTLDHLRVRSQFYFEPRLRE